MGPVNPPSARTGEGHGHDSTHKGPRARATPCLYKGFRVLKASLSLRQTQRLSMTPELRQALGLLQMSALELRDMVREALEHNLLLEKTEDSNDAPATPEEGGPPPDADNPEEKAPAEPEELPVAEWDSAEITLTWSDGGEAEVPEPAAQPGASLREHLLLQLNLAHLSARDTAIGTLLIDSLNDDGYLTESLDELRQAGDPADGDGGLHGYTGGGKTGSAGAPGGAGAAGSLPAHQPRTGTHRPE